MTRIWQDFRGGTDLDPVTKPTMEPGGIPASFIVIENTNTTGADISYAAGAAGYPIGAEVTWRGVPTYLRWDEPTPDAGLRYVIRFPVQFAALPEAFTPYAQLRNSAGSIMAEVGVDTSGRLYVNDQVGPTPPAERFQGTASTLYWAQLAVTTGDGDGITELHVTDDTEAVLFDWTNATASTGTQAIAHYRVGTPGTDGSVTTDFTVPTGGLVMGDLDTGWWPYLAPDNINIRPIERFDVGPGEVAGITAELWNQEAGAAWTWMQTSGPDLTLTPTDATADVTGMDRWNADSATPVTTSAIDRTPAAVEVSATLNGQTAPAVQVPIDILPQITWTRQDGGAWVGGTVAPACEEE